MADFDVIVVGAGVAGSAAAIKCAQKGMNVLLVDRAKPIGSKNLSGGVLWGHDLEDIIPDWWKEGLAEGAVERPITTKGINLLTKESGTTIQFNTQEWKKEPYNAFTVLRGKFDLWLSEKAAKAGVTVVDGVRVDKIAFEGEGAERRAVGIEQEGATITADCVIIADGANSRLTMEMGIRDKLDRENYVLGVKEIIKMDPKVLEDRFAIGENEGAAHEFLLGYLENGAQAGGFLYTNRDTISLGVVINLNSIWEKGEYTHRIMEEFRLHPTVAPLLKGGELVEYGAHLIPHGAMHSVPGQISGNGWMVIGDAAGFVYSNGLVIHGMNYAIRSGLYAAEAAIIAKERGDYSKHTLQYYDVQVKDSFIWKDFNNFAALHDFVWNPVMHGPVPRLAEGIFKAMFTATGEPKRHLEEVALELLKKEKLGPITLAKTALQARKAM